MSAIDLVPETGETGSEGEVECVVDPLEKYGHIDLLLIMENLSDHFAEVKRQLSDIKTFIEDYDDLNKEHLLDSGKNGELDNKGQEIRWAFENFEINKKRIDITKLSKNTDHKVLYNEVVELVNNYIVSNMPRSGEEHLKTL